MRYQVRLHFGRCALPCRNFQSYRSARAYASTLRRASVHLIITEGEARALCVLVGVVVAAVAYIQLGA